MDRAAPGSILRGCSVALVAALALVACTTSSGSGARPSASAGAVTGGSPAPVTTSGPAGGTTTPGTTPTTAAPTGPSSSPSPAPVTMADARNCPATVPNGPAPSAMTYGNGKLRVGLWPHGVIDPGPSYLDAHGRVRMKFPWWRMVRGRLRLSGVRLDAPAPPILPYVPDGYGPTGFQATSITFPTQGCWRITGTAGPASLTFVAFVIDRHRNHRASG